MRRTVRRRAVHGIRDLREWNLRLRSGLRVEELRLGWMRRLVWNLSVGRDLRRIEQLRDLYPELLELWRLGRLRWNVSLWRE